MKNKAPEFNGSRDYIERCGDLMRSFHDCMVSKQYTTAISIVQELHSELLPWMDKDSVIVCADLEKKGLNQLGHVSGTNNNINVRAIHNWYRKLNMIFHETGLGMKSSNVTDDVWMV